MICVECELLSDTTIRLCPYHAATSKLLAALKEIFNDAEFHCIGKDTRDRARAVVAEAEGK